MKDDLEQINYGMPKLGKAKWSLYVLGLFFASFVMYFPAVSVLEGKVKSALSSLPGCPIAYKSANFSFFLPKLKIEGLTLPSSCFGRRGQDLKLDQTKLHIRGLSFSPFGPHFKLETSLYGNPLAAYVSAGIGGFSLAMDDASVDLGKISPLLPGDVKLAGKADINLLAKATTEGLKEADLKLASKSFAFPAQTIQSFAFKRMDINNVLLKAQMEPGGLIKVRELIVGDANSPIRANFGGSVRLNRRTPVASRLDLKGEVAFSEQFLDDYAVIGMVMNQFDKKDDFYQIQLQGTLAAPSPSSPRK